ncbi:tyrosine-type recombinase/integrase [Mycobacterium sp. DL592]|uniref:tyrosine-type recombinase/integrase n=1 Tax=Mycobacterium sp. DL592 TaxID=2675524 RepID=UPI0014201043|nr:tyrosine-type recombinase/integrase [Mycobacterium sp. DL592]
MSANDLSRARVARRKANSLRLKLVRRGDVFWLRDETGGLLLKGDISRLENYLAERFVARQPGPAAHRIPEAWAPMITDYCLELAAAGQTAPTIRARRLGLARIARGLGVPPEDVTGDQLKHWFGGQTQWGLNTRRQYRSVARGFFSWAYKTGRVTDYLGDHLPKVRESVPSPRPVPDQIWRDALAAADARVTVMLRLSAEAGMRRAEVAQVHTNDLVDGAGGAQLLVHGKGNKQRLVPISDELASVVRAGPGGHTPGLPATGYLFPSRIEGVPLTAEYVGVLVGRVLPEAYSMHKLRHRYATRAYRGTRNLRAVQQLLGHASIATTERYTAVDDDEVRATAMAAVL